MPQLVGILHAWSTWFVPSCSSVCRDFIHAAPDLKNMISALQGKQTTILHHFFLNLQNQQLPVTFEYKPDWANKTNLLLVFLWSPCSKRLYECNEFLHAGQMLSSLCSCGLTHHPKANAFNELVSRRLTGLIAHYHVVPHTVKCVTNNSLLVRLD